MKKVFLDELPKRGRLIDWKNSVGYKVKFIYDDIEGYIEIVDYYKNNYNKPYLTIKYIDKIKPIFISRFKSCELGNILGKITNEFKIEIGTTFKDNKRDITIIDREYREVKIKDKKCKKGYAISKQKWYKYHCNIDNNEDWIVEGNLLIGNGCNVCSGDKVIEYNCMWNTDRELCEQLGIPEEIAKTVTRGSHTPITFTCKYCKNIVNVTPSNIINNKSIGCNCGDGVSYPEKFMFNMLTQLGIDFIWQLTKTNFKWCGKYKYDFYFEYNNEKYIIEANGIQHYKETNRGRSLEEEQINDKLKHNLAIKSGIKPENYIVIDCRKSELDFIKQNILDSRLNKIFELTKINWLECEEYTLKNIVKEVCDWWKKHREINKEYITTTDLSKVFCYSKTTIIKYLKKGAKFGWCNYNPNEEKSKSSCNNGKKNGKRVLVYDLNMNYITEGESATWLQKHSIEKFGICLYINYISDVATGKRPHYKGFIFKYAKDVDK